MLERGLHVDHTTIYRWVQQYAPQLQRRCRPHLKPMTDSWRVDETSIKVKKEWVYLYRAADWHGNTLEFLLSATRDAQAAKRFFLKTLAASHTSEPGVINVDKNAAYPKAFAELKAEGRIPESCELRQVRYLNNLVEQDHRFIKRLTKPAMGLFSFETAWRALRGFEMMNMMRKGQLHGVEKGDVAGQVALVAKLFGVAALTRTRRRLHALFVSFAIFATQPVNASSSPSLATGQKSVLCSLETDVLIQRTRRRANAPYHQRQECRAKHPPNRDRRNRAHLGRCAP